MGVSDIIHTACIAHLVASSVLPSKKCSLPSPSGIRGALNRWKGVNLRHLTVTLRALLLM